MIRGREKTDSKKQMRALREKSRESGADIGSDAVLEV